MNGILNGSDILKEWKERRVKLLHKGGRTDEWKNYRPIAIINITCKLCMLMVRERIDKWTEDSGMLGEIQCGFRRGRRAEDNLFMLERLIEMVKWRKEEICVAFLDMGKAYDRVNRKKLFEVKRWYGVHEKLVRLIERIYDGSMVKFELEKVTTRGCKSDSGVRHGCPLSPLFFNIYFHMQLYSLTFSLLQHSNIRKCDKQLCTWSQICSGGKGWCHGMEDSSRTSICRSCVSDG